MSIPDLPCDEGSRATNQRRHDGNRREEEAYVDPAKTDEQQLLAERLAGWTEKYPDVRVERLVTCGPPTRSLLEQAAEAQLVVVESRGRGEFVGLVLGSVSNALVHRAACPVVVVRAAAGWR
jgi:nucleotide-binding universal stress UspA family protein